MDKRMSIQDALDLIPDGAGVAVSGFMLMATPRELYLEIAKRYQETGHPCNLTIMHAAGNGNNKDQGIYDMTYEGLITRYITGHFANNSRMMDLTLSLIHIWFTTEFSPKHWKAARYRIHPAIRPEFMRYVNISPRLITSS